MGLSKILQYGFLTFLFLLPFQTVFLWREPFIDGEKWQYGTIGIYATDILLVVILVLALSTWLRSIKYPVSSIQYGGVEMALFFFLCWIGLSVLWAPDQLLALSSFAKLFLAAGLFFVARSSVGLDMKKIVFVLLIAGVIQSGIGIAQFLYQYSPDSVILGMGAHEAFQVGSSVLKIDSGRFLRAYGTFPHPNMLGGFLGVILVLIVWFFSFVISAPEPESSLKTNRLARRVALEWLSIAGMMILLLGLILTFSRAVWLGVGFGIAALCIFSFFLSDTRKLRSSFSGMPFKIFGILGITLIVFVLVFHEQISPRFNVATIEREGSVSERMQSFEDAFVLIKDRPFFGTGAGNFTAEMIRLQPDRPVWSIQPAHNVFVLVLAELGLVGCIFFGAFLWGVFQNIKKKNMLFVLALLALVPSILLDHWLWSSHFGLFFFFLFLGLSQSKDESIVN